jgi:hypothetical protein
LENFARLIYKLQISYKWGQNLVALRTFGRLNSDFGRPESAGWWKSLVMLFYEVRVSESVFG